MIRKSIGLTWKSSTASPWTKRVVGLGALTVSVAAVSVLYACSGDDTNPSTTPPVNDAGGDTGPVVTPDGGDANTGEDAGMPLCSSLPGNIVYIESADTQETLLDYVGRELRDTANITIVFLLTGSCTVTADIYAGGPGSLIANTPMLYIPSTAENATWTPAQPEYNCTTGSSTPTPDMAIAALFPSSCGTQYPPAGSNVAQFIGPTQAYTFIVPTPEFTNGQTSISAAEAYYAYGFGAQNPVTITSALTPEWNIPSQLYVRPTSKSTLISTALNVGLTAATMADILPDGGTSDGRIVEQGSGGMLSALEAASAQPQAIGILGDEVYDGARGKGVNVLAFKTFGQDHAYYPDSTPTAFDKQNIRDGHYTLWSPDVYMAPATNGVANNPAVQYLLDIIQGNPGATPPDGGAPITDAISITATAGLTPSCAMQVTRSKDAAPLIANPLFATNPCTCKFLASIPGATATSLPASCTTCTTSADCGDAAGLVGCFNGYCEVAPTPFIADGGCDDTTTWGINACTNAQAVDKVVNYPTDDGGLEPLP